MKIQSMPKAVLVELLLYLADHEPFEGLENKLGQDFSVEVARTALRELAVQLSAEIEQEHSTTPDLSADYLSKASQQLLAVLSPREERKLLKAFGFLEN